MTDSGFSFLKLMGREPAPQSMSSAVNIGIKNSAEKKPILLKLNSSNDSLEILKKALKTGILDEANKKHSIFAVNFDDIRSVASSFRQHNLNHLQQNWNKYRDSFVQTSKKRRKLAVKESRTGKPANFLKYRGNQNGKIKSESKHDNKPSFNNGKPEQKQQQEKEDGQRKPKRRKTK